MKKNIWAINVDNKTDSNVVILLNNNFLNSKMEYELNSSPFFSYNKFDNYSYIVISKDPYQLDVILNKEVNEIEIPFVIVDQFYYPSCYFGLPKSRVIVKTN